MKVKANIVDASPTKLVYIWLLVEVVVVLADVVQLGVDGGFVLAVTVFRHSSVTFARKR